MGSAVYEAALHVPPAILPCILAIIRLKVVGLPDGYGEDQLRSLFALAGEILEARVVHDKASGRAVG